MQSKNKASMTIQERHHVARVKMLPCSVCDLGGEGSESEAHEVKQGQWFTSIALCASCHRNEKLGWHGRRVMWSIKKMDELDALSVTLQRLLA